MQADDTVDVVVVGSGLAGLVTALAACQHDLSVMVLEKTDWLGGASCWSYGAIWVGNNDQAAGAGIVDSPKQVTDYLAFLGGGENRPARTAALVEHGPAALRMLLAAGIKIDLMSGVGDILWGKAPGAVATGRTLEPAAVAGTVLGDWRPRLRTPPGDEWRVPKSVVARMTDPAAVHSIVQRAAAADQLAQGAGLIAALLVALRERGVPIVEAEAVESLITDQGKVAGVVTSKGRSLSARRGVMLATGNYLSNPAMAASLDYVPEFRSWFPPGSTGDGVVLAGEIGGAVGIIRNNMAVMLGYEDPDDPSSANAGVPSVRDIPRAHTMLVNREGKRFGNEALFQETAQALRILDVPTRQPRNVPCWMIFDTQYVRKWGFAGRSPTIVPDWVPRAGDLTTLALQAGIDAPQLAATAARFNLFAQSGIDEDFGRRPGWAMTPGAGSGPNPSLGSIAVAPFYAVRLYPTLGAGGGIQADASARVLNWRGRPIPGLYAAGDAAHHDDFGCGYQAGVTFESAMTFAYLAAQDMAAAADP